jgi:hypothetical protein
LLKEFTSKQFEIRTFTTDLQPEGDEAVEADSAEAAEAVPPEVAMDELLESAFLRACKLLAKKPELPILSSNFFRLHVVTSCPPGAQKPVFKLHPKGQNSTPRGEFGPQG